MMMKKASIGMPLNAPSLSKTTKFERVSGTAMYIRPVYRKEKSLKSALSLTISVETISTSSRMALMPTSRISSRKAMTKNKVRNEQHPRTMARARVRGNSSPIVMR